MKRTPRNVDKISKISDTDESKRILSNINRS